MREIVRKGALGERIRDYAAVKGIPVSTLEREAKLSAGMVSRWIAAGDEDYNALTKLVSLCDLLGVSLDDLVGWQTNDSSTAAIISPIPQLQAETCARQLIWYPWRPDNGFPVTASPPVCKSGRPCCGGWWAERKQLKFILSCFCDDAQDDDETLELSLHCTPGHKLPLVYIPPSPDASLSQLYTQILLIADFTSG